MDELKAYLDNNNISVGEFAGMLDCHPDTVYKWLRGETRPSYVLAVKIEIVTKSAITRYCFYPEFK